MLNKNLAAQALTNEYFRRVVDTGNNTQIVVMSVPEDIGEEVHEDNDQILYLVEGFGRVTLDGESFPFEEGDAVLVTSGTRHNFINEGAAPMKIITTYSPPHHPPGTVHETKEDANS